MAFFKKKEKGLAKNCTTDCLRQGYRLTEQELIKACRTGKISEVKSAMKEHRKFEYALLYKEMLKNKK